MSSFVVHVNRVLRVNVVKQISTIVKGLYVLRIIRIVLMGSIHSIVNVKQISKKVRFHRSIEKNETFVDLVRDGSCVEMNPCDSSPCFGNATCYNLNHGQYRCMCPPTYTGNQCETDIDECKVFPSICRNGGT